MLSLCYNADFVLYHLVYLIKYVTKKILFQSVEGKAARQPVLFAQCLQTTEAAHDKHRLWSMVAGTYCNT